MISICIIDNIVVAAAAAAAAAAAIAIAIVVIFIAVVVIMQTSHIKVGVGSIDGRHSKSLIEAGVIFQPSLDDFGILSADVDNGGGGVMAQQVEGSGGEDLFLPLNRM
jgi:hypothetical protein